MTTTPVATAATGQPEWARCRGRGEQSLHCAFVAQFPVVGSSKAGRIGLVYGRFSHQIEAHAAMLLAPIPLIMGTLSRLRGETVTLALGEGKGPPVLCVLRSSAGPRVTPSDTSIIEVLRQPLESALCTAVAVTGRCSLGLVQPVTAIGSRVPRGTGVRYSLAARLPSDSSCIRLSAALRAPWTWIMAARRAAEESPASIAS